VLVGRGDPNLSNRKFPYALKEEFDGPPEKALVELADALVAKGVKEINGDVIGDDSYFPREPYPNGWEIDDMVWEYGAAVSAIVVDDNTVALTLTPADTAGGPVQAQLDPGRFPKGRRSAAPGSVPGARLVELDAFVLRPAGSRQGRILLHERLRPLRL